jgi:tRNA 5-methylaminomethyl-2-thiouridine biosynthesis bifunctional protein
MHHVGMIPRSALILGAGLAGTALARALVLRDWRVTLIDDADPQAGSRQLALAVHPAHAPDASPASELSRIAMALLAADARGSVPLAPGWLELPRLQRMPKEQAERLAQAWPDGPLQARQDGLFWRQPCAVVPASLLAGWQLEATQTGRLEMQNFRVDALQGDATGWHALSADRSRSASASVAVVCAGARSEALLGSSFLAAGGWQVRHAQCRISQVAIDVPRQVIGLQGEGYQIPLPDGRVLCGPGGLVPGPAGGFAELKGSFAEPESVFAEPESVLPRPGRTDPSRTVLLDDLPQGARASVRDHLPLVGAVPDLPALERHWPAMMRNDRLPMPRVAGLWMISALGGRGLLWCLPAAEHLAASLSNTPSMLDARLGRAIDPGRFLRRALRAGTPHLTKALGLA